jgi:transposase
MAVARNAEVVLAGPRLKRRYRSKQERRQIVEETLQPGASVAVIARQHGVNANQVFHWRKLYRKGWHVHRHSLRSVYLQFPLFPAFPKFP